MCHRHDKDIRGFEFRRLCTLVKECSVSHTELYGCYVSHCVGELYFKTSSSKLVLYS